MPQYIYSVWLWNTQMLPPKQTIILYTIQSHTYQSGHSEYLHGTRSSGDWAKMVILNKLLHKRWVVLQHRKSGWSVKLYGCTYQCWNGENLDWLGHSANGIVMVILSKALHQFGVQLTKRGQSTSILQCQEKGGGGIEEARTVNRRLSPRGTVMNKA